MKKKEDFSIEETKAIDQFLDDTGDNLAGDLSVLKASKLNHCIGSIK